MTFKYYGLSPSPPISASATFINDFQELLYEEFSVATDVFDIQEEEVFASGIYVDIQVRITSAVSPETGVKLGDDWKRILFSDIDHPISVGMKYSFSDSVWTVINCENIKSLTASATIRRCNNQLKWMSGSTIYTEECAIEYDYKNPRFDIPKSDLVTPSAYIRIYAQQNSKTNTIKPNQRFLFGNTSNWTCLRVLENRNFLNQKTADNSSSRLLTLEVQRYQIGEDTDDLVNGVADYYFYVQSGSSTAINTIVVEPNNPNVLEGTSQTFDCHYYSGSSIISGSFVFSPNNNDVPVDHYSLSTLTINTFSITNNEIFLDYPLSILCSGSSGSRVFDINLQGLW